MKGKILFLTGLGLGYLLGTRAGRERYEQMKSATLAFWNDPRVQKQVDAVEGFVKEKAPEVADFVSDNAKKVVGQVSGKKPEATSPEATKPEAKKPAATKPTSSGSASS